MKSFQIRSFFWSVFSRIRTEYTERYEGSLRFQSEYGKIRTRKNSVFGYFTQCPLSLLLTFKQFIHFDCISTAVSEHIFVGFLGLPVRHNNSIIAVNLS